MIMQAFLRGILMGLSIAAPVGPIAVIVIRRTLMEGRLAGLVCGLGCTTALALYGGVVGFGVAVVSGAVLTYQTPLLIGGGLFLGYLGVTIARTPGVLPTAAPKGAWDGLPRAYASTFALTLVNPIVVVYFIATIAAGGVTHITGSYSGAVPLVLGVATGSALWWTLLSGGVGFLRARLNATWLGWANRVSGLVIAVMGARVLLQLI
jgi:threonine/homoserine/homoserine lactone efflux protein